MQYSAKARALNSNVVVRRLLRATVQYGRPDIAEQVHRLAAPEAFKKALMPKGCRLTLLDIAARHGQNAMTHWYVQLQSHCT